MNNANYQNICLVLCGDRAGGVKILQQVKERYPGVPIIFYTRKGTLEDAVFCKDKGVDDILKKPHPENFNEKGNVRKQLEEAALNHKDTLTREFSRLVSTSGWTKIKKIARFVWANWSKF